jgi:hypothetical protein
MTLMSSLRSLSVVNWTAGGLIVAAGLLFDLTQGAANWAALHLALALCLVWFAIIVIRGGAIRLALPHTLAALLFIYAAQSLAWSPDPAQGAYQLLNAGALLAVFFVAPYIRGAIPWAVSIAFLGALALDAIIPWGGFGNENFATEFLLIASPFAAVILLMRQRILGVWAFALLFAYLIGTNPSKVEYFAAAAIALGFGLWLAYWRTSENWRIAAGFGLVGMIAGGALIGWQFAGPDMQYSVTSRVEIWLGTWEAFRQAPIFGHGFGSWMHFYPPLQEHFLTILPNASLSQTELAGYPPAAHLEPLQFLAELGVVGAVIAVGFLVSVARSGRRGEVEWAAWLTLLVAAPVALIEFPLQQPPTALLVALALGLLAGKGERVTISIPARWWSAGATVSAAAIVAVLGWNTYHGEVNLARSKAATQGQEFLSAVVLASRAVDASALNWRVRSHFLFAVNNADRFNAAVVEVGAQDAAYELAQTASPYFLGHLLIRYEQLRRGARGANEALAIVRQIERQAPVRAGRILASIRPTEVIE